MKKINNRGITLISLIITIAILLILSAVVISLATSGGLLDNAREHGDKTQNKLNQHQEVVNEMISEWENLDIL